MEPAAPEPDRSGRDRSAAVVWAVATATAAMAALARLPALHQPLDRDMGAHAAIGAYLSQGLVPYVDVIDNKQPLPYLLYALLETVRPHSTALIRLTGLLIAVATVLAVVVLGRRVIGLPRAAAAGLLVAIAGASRWVQGVDLNTEHLLVLPAALAVLLPLAFPERRGRGWSVLYGSLVALAALSKAPGVLLAAPVLVALLWPAPGHERPGRATVGWFALGGALPVVPLLAWYAAMGELDGLVYWNVTYNLTYSAAVAAPWWRWIVPAAQVWPVVALGAAGAVVVAVRLVRRGHDRTAWTLAAWLAIAYVGARIGQRDFPHYYAPLVVPAALALLLPAWPARRRRILPAVAAAAAVSGLFAVDVVGQFGRTGDELAIRLYRVTQAEPWLWHDEVGAYLRSHAGEGDELYVVGNEPGFYWSSRLPPASPHIVSFPGEVLDDFDRAVAADLAADPPAYVVQPYGRTLWPAPAAPLADLAYEPVASFGPVTVLRLVGG